MTDEMNLYQKCVQNLSLTEKDISSPVSVNFKYEKDCNFNIEYWIKISEIMRKVVISNEDIKSLCNVMLKRIEAFVGFIFYKNPEKIVKNVYIGGLWDGNKIEDIIFREICYKKTNLVPVILNYINDTPEMTTFKLVNSSCSLLIYDKNISNSYIEEVKTLLLKKHKTEILTLSSSELVNESDILMLVNEDSKRNNLENYLNLGINSEKQEYLGKNYKENIPLPSYLKETEYTLGRIELNKIKTSEIEKTMFLKENGGPFSDSEAYIYEALRNIIYTTGTTGTPKGVKLSYKNFEATNRSIDILCTGGNCVNTTFVITNPLHHINSTCFVDYCLRNSVNLVLFHRYSRDFWSILSEIIKERLACYGNNFSIIIPLVPKHIEYFISTLNTKYYNNKNEMMKNLSHPSIRYFFGSSTVSYDFFRSFKELFNGKIPRVRFGSTETCLQVCGTDILLSDELIETGFKRGLKEEGSRLAYHLNCGYFIGRSVYPHSEVIIVKSIELNSSNFLIPCDEYELGYIICRGDNVMKGYIDGEDVLINNCFLNAYKGTKYNNTDKRVGVCDNHPWYIGLGDQGFWIRGEKYSEKEIATFGVNYRECACCKSNIFVDNYWIYWVSRSKYIIKIGGVKYSSEEINKRLRSEIVSLYNISFPENFKSAVVGFKEPTSEDDKIVFFYEKHDNITVNKLEEHLKILKIPKSYIPYKIIETDIKMNSKGTVDFEEMKKFIIDSLKND